jgi:hypothetical protein
MFALAIYQEDIWEEAMVQVGECSDAGEAHGMEGLSRVEVETC